jgi:hypothetical protein
MNDLAPAWRPLPGQVESVPYLLVSARFTSSSYVIHLTDLAHIWAESLDRKAICMRGFDTDTSIDPSEGADQMQELLKRIRASLDADLPGHEQTSLSLAQDGQGEETAARDHRGRSQRDQLSTHLVLRLTCILPKPLRPLKWPILLTQRPPSELATELVLPLIQALAVRSERSRKLVAVISQKDKVISRLVDKLEATGTGLEQVFNPLTARRRVSRAVLEERVPGLAPFKQHDPQLQEGEASDTAFNDENAVGGLIQKVFGPLDGLIRSSSSEIAVSRDLDEWWTNLGTEAGIDLVICRRSTLENDDASTQEWSVRHGGKRQSAAADSDATSVNTDDEFQVQATPPRVADRRHPPSSQVIPSRPPEASEDYRQRDDKDDDDSVIPESQTNKQTSNAHGTAGLRHPNLDSPKTQLHRSYSHGSETASEGSGAASSAGHRVAQQRSGVGRIGGRPKPVSKQLTSTQSRKRAASFDSGSFEPAASPETPKARRGAGKIRERNTPPSAQQRKSTDGQDVGVDDSRDGEAVEISVQKKPHSPAQETEEAKADKKRTQLHSTLQGKAGGVAKKKRKF